MIFPTTIKGSYIERMTDEEFFHFCQENQDYLLNNIGPMYMDQQRAKGLKLVDQDGNEVA